MRVVVEDTGIGIAEEDLQRLFVPFERLGAAAATVEGTGLGLTVTKSLVELMGGRIGVRSLPGEGSSFWIELMVAEAPADRPVAQVPSDDAGSHEDRPSRVVLYVEDNLANVRLVERILARRPNVELLLAMQGSDALELIGKHHPSLVLLDLHLPDMEGEEVLRRVRADAATAGTQVVVVSADAAAGQLERLRESGADGYLTKPFDVGRFLAIIDGAADLPPSQRVTERSADDSSSSALDAGMVAQLTTLAGPGEAEQDRFRTFIRTFLQEGRDQLTQLRASVLAGHLDLVAERAHRLCGGSGSLGASAVADLCRRIEIRAAGGDLSGVPELLVDLEHAFAEAENALRETFIEGAGCPPAADSLVRPEPLVLHPASTPSLAPLSSDQAYTLVRSVLDRPESLGIVFQPIVDVFDGRVVGVEALTRVNLDRPLSPDAWFREASRVGLGTELEVAALERAVALFDEIPGELLSLNLSVETLLSEPFAEFVRGLGERSRRVVLEITEQAQVVAYGEVEAVLAPVRSSGVRLAVDDAGAGYSSFRHILRLGPDIIQLDRSIISGLDADPARRALATAVADYAAEIGAVVIAEGVERVEELRIIRTTGIRWVQGYLTGRPSPLPVEVSPLAVRRVGRRAVVIDDDAAVRVLVWRVLRRSGFDVLGEASDGLEGLLLCETLRPDLIVLDLKMPAKNGAQALPHLRGTLPDTKIVVLSGDVNLARAVAREYESDGTTEVVDKAEVATRLAEVLSALE